ncbi:hypothetical protein ABPG72_021877 [Tetrahymena utriculariae]
MKAVIINIQKQIEDNSAIKAELISQILKIFEKKYKNYIYLEYQRIQADSFFLNAFNAETLENVYLKFSIQNQVLEKDSEQKQEIILNLIKQNQVKEQIPIKDTQHNVLIEETIDNENYSDRYQRIKAEKKTFYSYEVGNETKYVRQVTAIYQRRDFNMDVIISDLNLLESHPYLKTLDLNLNNNIFFEGEGTLLGTWISQFSYLEDFKLDIDSCNIQTDQLVQLFNLISNCSNLKKLDLTFRMNQNQPIFNEMGACLGKLHLLEYLSINQSLNKSLYPFGDCTLFGQGLANCKNLKELLLDSAFCSSQNENLQLLALGLNNLQSIQKLHLNLMQNNLEKDSLIGILQEISDCQQIEELSLNLSNNQIQDDSLLKLFKEISKLQLLKKLSIQLMNDIVDQNQLIGFGESLSKCSQLQYIKLTSKSEIQKEEDDLFEIMGNEISKIKSIKSLEIYLNHTSITNLQNLCKNFGFLENLEEISIISITPLQYQKMQGLDKIISQIKNLKKLSIYSISKENQEGNKSELFEEFLSNCLNLSDLELTFRGLSLNQLADTLNRISKIQTLQRLSLNFLCLSTDTIDSPQLISSYLSRLNKLKYLHFCLSQNNNVELITNVAKGLADLKEVNELKFEVWYSTITDQGAQILLKQIQKINKLYTIHLDLRLITIRAPNILKKMLLKSPYLVNKVFYV